MKLLQVKTSKIPGRVWLIFDDKSYIPFSIDDWVKLNLTLPADIDLSQIVDTMFLFLLKSYALNQIALSPKVRADLIPKCKLKARMISQKYKVETSHLNEIIDSTLDYLEINKLLNESDYVDYVLKKYSHKSKSYIIQYLQLKRINTKNYPKIFAKNDSELLKKALESRKYKTMDRHKVIASLLRKGFTYEDIKATI